MDLETQLYSYQCYRTFLCHYAQKRRAENPRWSIGAWARALGLRGTASLSMILNGQRNPGPRMTTKLCDFFGFKTNERRYFADLVRIARYKDPLAKIPLEQVLRCTNHHTVEDRILTHSEFSAMSNWVFFVVRELTKLENFREDPEWIRRQLVIPVSCAEIENALTILKQVHLLVYNTDGKLVPHDLSFSTTNDIANEAITTFHENALTLAKSRLYAEQVEFREFQSITFAFRSEQMKAAKAVIRRFQDEFAKLFEADQNGDSVHQLSIQLIPLTKNQS